MHRRLSLILLLAIISVSAACTAQNDKKVFLTGRITVADSLSNTPDYSGIRLSVFPPDTTETFKDTLFTTLTNYRGDFSGTFTFERNGRYPVLISRGSYDLGLIEVLFSDSDTVRITGELPDVASTFEVDSRENRALRTYDNVRRTFERTIAYVNAGKVADEDIPAEFSKFAELFWTIYQDNKGTTASGIAASESFRIMNTMEADSLMNARLNANLDDPAMIDLALQYGTALKAREEGLTGVIRYLDLLKEKSQTIRKDMVIDQKRVKTLYDSLAVDQAVAEFKLFKNRYSRFEDMRPWITLFERELNYMAPGLPVPTYDFIALNGDTLSTADTGNPRLYEFADLTNPFYQQEFENIKYIALIYSNYGLEVLSVPVNENQVAINAFFNERGQTGPILDRRSYNTVELIQAFNLSGFPTWLLVDREGKIIRKYVGEEIEDLTNGLAGAIK